MTPTAAERVAVAAHALREHDETCRESALILRGTCDTHGRDRMEFDLDAALEVWRAERAAA